MKPPIHVQISATGAGTFIYGCACFFAVATGYFSRSGDWGDAAAGAILALVFAIRSNGI